MIYITEKQWQDTPKKYRQEINGQKIITMNSNGFDFITLVEVRKEVIKMTKKDYELIANVFKNYNEWIKGNPLVSNRGLIELIVEGLAKKLEQDNPRFNYTTFRKACGYEY